MRADARRRAVNHNFKNPTDCIARAQHLVDFGFHALFCFGINAVQQDLIFLASATISSQLASRSSSAWPTRITWLATSIPSDSSSSFANAPAATRAVDSRADARSRT